MVKRESLFVQLLVAAILISVGGIVLNLVLLHPVTGATDSGEANFTQGGAAGITLVDTNVSFGTGYFNSTCTQDYSVLDSETPSVNPSPSPNCWVNLSDYPLTPDYHRLRNTGTTPARNLTVLGDKSASDFYCGMGVTCTTDPTTSRVEVKATNAESGSCATNLQSTYTTLSQDTSNVSVTLCRNFLFKDTKDELNTYYNLTVPSGTSAGLKSLTVTYEVTA